MELGINRQARSTCTHKLLRVIGESTALDVGTLEIGVGLQAAPDDSLGPVAPRIVFVFQTRELGVGGLYSGTQVPLMVDLHLGE